MILVWIVTWLFLAVLNYGSMLSRYKMEAPKNDRARKVDKILIWLGPVGLWILVGKWLWVVLKWQAPDEILKEEQERCG